MRREFVEKKNCRRKVAQREGRESFVQKEEYTEERTLGSSSLKFYKSNLEITIPFVIQVITDSCFVDLVS